MASSNTWKSIGETSQKILNHPVGQQVAAHLINELISWAIEAIKDSRKQSLTEADRAGYNYMLQADSATTSQARHLALVNARNAYTVYAIREASYNAFYGNFWAGISCLQLGDGNNARAYFSAAYYCGARLIENDSLRPADRNDPDWDRAYNVAVIMDTVLGPCLNK